MSASRQDGDVTLISEAWQGDESAGFGHPASHHHQTTEFMRLETAYLLEVSNYVSVLNLATVIWPAKCVLLVGKDGLVSPFGHACMQPPLRNWTAILKEAVITVPCCSDSDGWKRRDEVGVFNRITAKSYQLRAFVPREPPQGRAS